MVIQICLVKFVPFGFVTMVVGDFFRWNNSMLISMKFFNLKKSLSKENIIKTKGWKKNKALMLRNPLVPFTILQVIKPLEKEQSFNVTEPNYSYCQMNRQLIVGKRTKL